MTKSYLKIPFLLLLCGLMTFVVASLSNYIFLQTKLGFSVMSAMLEWTASSYHWKALLGICCCLWAYGFYRAKPHFQNWNNARRGRWRQPTWGWKDETGWYAFYLSKVIMIWAIVGMKYHS